MKLCRHSYAADGSDRISDKAPSRCRHGFRCFKILYFTFPLHGSGSRVKGAYLPVEIFAVRRKYNRLPLDGETRNTLSHRKETMFLSLPSRQGTGGQGDWSPCRFLGQRPKPPEDIWKVVYAILSVIIPQMKQASSLATAVTATFLCLPLFSIR